MDRETIRRQLQAVMREVFDDDGVEISDATTAGDVKGWDSLNHINLVIAVEERFKVKLTTREVVSLKNVGEMLSLLQSKLG